MKKKKLKTNKAVRKRFRITKKGKVLSARTKRRHLMANRTPKAKRQSRGLHLIDPSDVDRVKRLLPYG